MNTGRFFVNASGQTVWKSSAGAAPAAPAQKSSSKPAAAAPSGNSTEIEQKVLTFLNTNNVIQDTGDFSAAQGVQKEELDPVLKSLTAENYLVLEVLEKRFIELTAEGEGYAQNGSPEYQFVSKMTLNEKVDMPEMEKRVGVQVAKIGKGKAMKNKWIEQEGDKKNPIVVRVVENLVDEDKENLQKFSNDPIADNHDKKNVESYKKRKHLIIKTIKTYKVTKGENFSTTRQKLEVELTAEMLRNDGYKDIKFKALNFSAAGAPGNGGHLHPLMKVREQFKEIFLEMGLEEMSTNRYVESSFWNFDALFQPQSHPARDAHDTFFIKNPEKCLSMPPDYMENVKQVHSTGGYGSRGYQYPWQKDEASKNLLRTHTTAVSSQKLYNMATSKEGFKPFKFFSIDRVFRNETLDATHLAEFHQCEGLIGDRNIGLSHLMGIISTFMKKIGVKKLKYKPAYNPYTEPSLEIFGYHPTLKKWIELGNSGIFRPEMLRPMGLPADVNVIAWGLSLERPTMIHYNISNIRELFGNKVPFSSTQNNKICYIVDEDK